MINVHTHTHTTNWVHKETMDLFCIPSVRASHYIRLANEKAELYSNMFYSITVIKCTHLLYIINVQYVKAMLNMVTYGMS